MFMRRTRPVPQIVLPSPLFAIGMQVVHPVHGAGQLDCIVGLTPYRVGVMKVFCENGFREYRRAPLDEFQLPEKKVGRRIRVRPQSSQSME